MESNNSREILEGIIKNFSTEQFIHFFRSKNISFKKRKLQEDLSNYNNGDFTSGEKIGEIEFQYNNLIVCAFRISKDLTARSGKKKQYELGKRILRETNTDAGIFIFYDQNGNFRLSLIYTDYLGTRRSFSYFKRFTYYVSPSLTNRTFLDQIGNADFSSLDKIKEAFSVEPVTKQFYEEIQNWYFWAMDKVKFPEDYKYSDDPEKDREIRDATNLIRLITRIIFIWFIKEKGLIPEELFDRDRLKDIVKDFNRPRGHNYYNAILQNLFFATLNSKMDERGWAKDEGYPKNRTTYGVKNLYRYEDKFLIGEEEVLNLFKEIPFLNGGLFDCLDKEDESGRVIYIDGFSRNSDKQAIIPDYLFFQQEETRVDLSGYGLGSNKPVRGLIEILKSYNFTIDENTPVDQEVALDPELLGKVFENLLASYNPETATTARKATGSYYTPREIVDYMVDESLKEYFKTQLPEIAEDKIELLVSYKEDPIEFSQDEKHKIISAIDRIKILDPACGSGAFPMGILHKLVHILQKIDPNNDLWYELQYQKALRASEEAFKEKDKSEREAMLKEINDAFDESINYPDYARKLYIIENCIYGVDIQPIAIQISKLRFFISLILDQKVDKTRENFGIRALPNLETKFVAANTLIGLEKPDHIFYTNEIKNLEEEIKRIRHKYFTAKTRKEKLSLQKEDKRLREELKVKLKSIGFSSESSERIASFDLYDPNASATWFDPEWMFGVNDGFDIVIGNPPYVRQENIEDKDLIIDSISRCFIDKNGESLIKINKRSDLYIYFYYRGLELLKNGGIFSFINSNSWLDVGFGAELQEFLLKHMNILMIVDNLVERSFDADINTVIVFIQKPTNKITDADIIKFVVFKEPYDKILNSSVIEQVHKTNVKTINEKFRLIVKTRKELWIEGIETEDDELNESRLWSYQYIGNKWGGKYLRAPEIFFKILEKGKDKFIKLGDIAEDYYGIKTGANEFFYLETTEKPAPKGLLHVRNSADWEGFIEEKFLKPVIKSPRELNTIIVKEEDLKYRVFMCHMSKSELKGTYALKYIEWGEGQGYHKRPTCASRPRWWDMIESKGNILCLGNLNDRFIFFYNRNDIIFEHTLYGLLVNEDIEKYILIINSSLTSLIHELHGRISLGEGALGLMVYEYLQLPILNAKFIGIKFNLSNFLTRSIGSIFQELGFSKCTQRNCKHPEHPYEYVKPEEVSFDRIMPDRRELDKIVFEAIGLTEEEQLEVYRAVLELVKNRLLKAKSK
jgi:hypothetical protein